MEIKCFLLWYWSLEWKEQEIVHFLNKILPFLWFFKTYILCIYFWCNVGFSTSWPWWNFWTSSELQIVLTRKSSCLNYWRYLIYNFKEIINQLHKKPLSKKTFQYLLLYSVRTDLLCLTILFRNNLSFSLIATFSFKWTGDTVCPIFTQSTTFEFSNVVLILIIRSFSICYLFWHWPSVLNHSTPKSLYLILAF